MEEVLITDFDGDVQMLLDVKLAEEFYKVYKEVSKYNSFTSFCRGMISSLKLKQDSGFSYFFTVKKSFNKVSGFTDDFSTQYVIDFLASGRYIRYCEIAELKYDISRNKI